MSSFSSNLINFRTSFFFIDFLFLLKPYYCTIYTLHFTFSAHLDKNHQDEVCDNVDGLLKIVNIWLALHIITMRSW